jgi:hypothetical protein
MIRSYIKRKKESEPTEIGYEIDEITDLDKIAPMIQEQKKRNFHQVHGCLQSQVQYMNKID